jgi:hypothetical protein
MFFHRKGDRFIDKAHDLWTDSGELAKTGATQANGFIHRKPMAATLLAVGAGLCLGMVYGGLRNLAAAAVVPKRRAAAPAKPRAGRAARR